VRNYQKHYSTNELATDPMTIEVDQDFIPQKTAAKMIGKSVQWLILRRKSEKDGPPWYKIGGRFMYKREEVSSWLESCRHAT